MSHYIVTVCLPASAAENIEEDLEAALAPFDKNTEVEPYREYISGEPEDHWIIKAMRREGDETRVSDWRTFVAVVKDRYGNDSYYDQYQMEVGKDGGPVRAFKWSTYNKRSKWDWYLIGGRWTGYYDLKPEFIGDPRVINGQAGAMTEPNEDRSKCDGGPVEMLNFESMRLHNALEGMEKYRRFHSIVSQHPAADGWPHFADLAGSGQMEIDDARRAYREQPAVQALDQDEVFRHWWGEPFEEFGYSEDDFIAIKRREAVSGFALLTLDGEWRGPGEMGWFGMSSDTPGSQEAFQVASNKYLEDLPGDTYVIAVDVHI